MSERILIVDDDVLLRQSLSFSLQQEQFEVTAAATAHEAIQQAQSQSPDLILLDIGLPDLDGRELCRQLQRERAVPIIFVTARGQEIDKVLGLQLGADDYIVKPFSTAELVARIRAVLRRSHPASPRPATLEAGPLTINPDTHVALFQGRPLELAPKEFQLLYQLARQAGHVVSTSALLAAVWGVQFQGEPQTLYVHIQRLRQQIEPDPRRPCYLLTVHRVGYKLDPEGRGHV